MSSFDNLKRTINQMAKANIKIALVRATVTEVDWDKKQMIVKSLVDDLEYFDVALGLDHNYQKPKVNTSCIIGVFDGYDAGGFLLKADEVEETIYKTNTTKLTIKEGGFIIEKGNENLTTILNDFMDEVMKIIVINGTTINVPKMALIKQRLNTVLT